MTTSINNITFTPALPLLLCFLFFGLFFSCSNTETPVAESPTPSQPTPTAPKKAASLSDFETTIKVKNNPEEVGEIDVSGEFSVPELEFESTRVTVERSFKRAIILFDKKLSNAEREDKTMNIQSMNNIPVSIWRIDGQPVKVEYGLKDDKGAFTKSVAYYLADNKPWYVEDDQFRYIYNNGLIKYRLDKKWQSGRINVSEFSQQKKYINETVDQILEELK